MEPWIGFRAGYRISKGRIDFSTDEFVKSHHFGEPRIQSGVRTRRSPEPVEFAGFRFKPGMTEKYIS